MENMKADLERAQAELQEKAAELNKLSDELDTLRRDNEVTFDMSVVQMPCNRIH